MNRKPLGVIILNWNGLGLLQKFLPLNARLTIDSDTDLIVADNGSSDGSADWVEANHPEVKLLRLDRNYGFAEGYNRAIKTLGYRYSLLLNSDVEVTPGWTAPLLSFMRKHPDVGAVQPKILSYANKEMFEYAGAAGGYLDCLGFPYCRGRVFDKVEADRGQYDDGAADVAWASGAALLTATDVYLRLGGLDPRFFAHMEEIDYCCRLWASGYRVCALSGSKVYHIGGASLPHGNPKKVYLNFRNNLLLLHKNLPRKRGRKVLFLRRLVDTAAMVMFLLKGHPADAHAVLKAHNDFRKMRRHYTVLPADDRLRTLPGADRRILLEHYLHLRHRPRT